MAESQQADRSWSTSVPPDQNPTDRCILPSLDDILKIDDLHIKEKTAKACYNCLEALRNPLLEIAKNGEGMEKEVRDWTKQIDAVQALVKKHRSVIGVVGNTGAGKSSLINVVLGVDNLIPTNGMEACTAVATEIHYNEQKGEFRAEVEYISKKEWTKEINLMLADLQAEDGKPGTLSRDHLVKDSEAGIAYSKVKAVYPQKTRTKDAVARLSRDELLDDADLLKILGSTVTLRSNTSDDLRHQLQEFLTSSEKRSRQPGKPKSMAVWPLIKVVKVFVAADALSTGTVIVDLPGVQDANPARSAVAFRYMANCSSLWIVTPIARAVEDKTAKSLFGDSFKLQVKMDGHAANSTIICTKADDISVDEITDTLDLAAEMGRVETEEKNIKNKLEIKSSLLVKMSDKITTVEANSKRADEEFDQWEGFETQAGQGHQVFLIMTGSKRKRPGGFNRSKQANNARHVAEKDATKADESAAYSSVVTLDPSVDPSKPLTTKDIQAHLEKLQDFLNSLAETGEDLETRLGEITKEKAELEHRLKRLPSREQICIRARNNFSSSRIKADFTNGLSGPEDDKHEDTGAGNNQSSVPVFCVSSRAYQSIKSGNDGGPGFPSLEDTGIPGLQAHAKQSNLHIRQKACDNALQDFTVICNGLYTWSGGVANALVTAEDREVALGRMKDVLARLKNQLGTAHNSAMVDWKDNVDAAMSFKVDKAVAHAKNKAPDICRSWPKIKGNNRDEGLVAASYRATCRRIGDGNKKNFNRELAQPFLFYLESGSPTWSVIFGKIIPSILDEIDRKSEEVSRAVYLDFKESRAYRSAPLGKRSLLDQKAIVHNRHIASLGEHYETIKQAQRQLSRSLEDSIRKHMQPVYEECAAIAGTGMGKKIAEKVELWVDKKSNAMYKKVAKGVKEDMAKIRQGLKTRLQEVINEAVQIVRSDYTLFIQGSTMSAVCVETMHKLRLGIEDLDRDFRKFLRDEGILDGNETTAQKHTTDTAAGPATKTDSVELTQDPQQIGDPEKSRPSGTEQQTSAKYPKADCAPQNGSKNGDSRQQDVKMATRMTHGDDVSTASSTTNNTAKKIAQTTETDGAVRKIVEPAAQVENLGSDATAPCSKSERNSRPMEMMEMEATEVVADVGDVTGVIDATEDEEKTVAIAVTKQPTKQSPKQSKQSPKQSSTQPWKKQKTSD